MNRVLFLSSRTVRRISGSFWNAVIARSQSPASKAGDPETRAFAATNRRRFRFAHKPSRLRESSDGLKCQPARLTARPFQELNCLRGPFAHKMILSSPTTQAWPILHQAIDLRAAFHAGFTNSSAVYNLSSTDP